MTKFNLKNYINQKNMKVKTTLATLVNSQEVLLGNMERGVIGLASQRLPIVLSYKISSVYKEIENKLMPFEKIRIEKIKEYGKEEEKDGEKKKRLEVEMDLKNMMD